MNALLTFACLTMDNSQQYKHGYVSELGLIEPKTQREARASPQAAKWRQSEHFKLKTIRSMETFLIVYGPKYVIPLPSRFTYSLKLNKDGNITRFKSRLVC